MEHNNLHDFLDVTSPRYQVELMEELQSVQGGKTQINLQFQDGQNPFSYYEKDNRRDMSSSQDDRSSQSSRSHQNLPDSTENHNTPPRVINPLQKEYPNVEIGQNLSAKDSIVLTNAAVKSGKEHEGIEVGRKEGPPLSIRLVKQVEVDLSNFRGKEKVKKTKQQIYQKELNKDIQELKGNIKNKNSHKTKQDKTSLKNQLYKTFSPAVSPKGDRDSSLQVQQLRMLIKMGFQKKKTNYAMLKEWDRKRAESLALHGRMIQLLQSEVDLRIKSSLENFQFYQTFFREKAKQQQKYVTSPVINTRYALQNNSLSKNVYINCSIILNELCDENVTRCKNIGNFIQLIRVNILKELTENHFNNSHKELLTIREKISSLKSSLTKYNTEAEERAKKLASLFGEQSENITNKFQKDFYRTQISFLRKTQQQIEVQTKLGEYCLEFYHTAIREEYKRSEVIRDAMLVYTKGLRQAYGVQFQCQEMQQMGKHEQVKLIEQFYALGDMFDERTVELFKLSNGIKTQGDISLEIFTGYIKGFSYDYFDSRVLQLKQYSVRYVTLVKSKQTTEQPCYLVITVDNFLHLFLVNSAKVVYRKPDVTLKISRKYLQFRGLKQQLVDIVKKQQKRNSMMSYFWDNRIQKVYRIRFSKKDSQQQFLDCVTKLSIDNY